MFVCCFIRCFIEHYLFILFFFSLVIASMCGIACDDNRRHYLEKEKRHINFETNLNEERKKTTIHDCKIVDRVKEVNNTGQQVNRKGNHIHNYQKDACACSHSNTDILSIKMWCARSRAHFFFSSLERTKNLDLYRRHDCFCIYSHFMQVLL